MQNFYLIDFFKKNKIIAPELLESLKYELDQNIYYYGDQFKYPRESNSKEYFKKNTRKLLMRMFAIFKIIQNRKIRTEKKVILSTAYFGVNQELKKHNFQVYCPSWRISRGNNVLSDFKLFISSERIKSKIENNNFNELISSEFLVEVKRFEEELKLFFQQKKLKALIVPNSVGFFENLCLHICKEINIPSFVFSHGLPAGYNSVNENRSDYLIVWGEKIKEHYISAGMNPDKIFVSGHPYYKEFKEIDLGFSLEKILVITKAMSGSQGTENVRLSDRGNSILYLYFIEKVLKGLGVKSVRFRPHPSESDEWYLKFINNDFYKPDKDALVDSIKRSSLVIGPTSTVFLESLYYGVNYVVYEPSINNMDFLNSELAPPFDGSEPGIHVAKNEKELEYILKNKKKINTSFFGKYIKSPFDLSFINDLIFN